MATEGNCPNCGKALSDKVVMLPEGMLEYLRMFNPQPSYALCTKCGGDKLYTAHTRMSIVDMIEEIEKLWTSVPLVSTHLPLKWDYDVLGLVTGQSVLGTGVISEFSASISDLLGGNSPAFVDKIVQGENAVFSHLIRKAIGLGGNAVIAVDIDYSEMGAGRGMIMVCSTGTAITLKNREILGKERNERIDALFEKLQHVEKIGKMESEYKAFREKYRLL